MVRPNALLLASLALVHCSPHVAPSANAGGAPVSEGGAATAGGAAGTNAGSAGGGSGGQAGAQGGAAPVDPGEGWPVTGLSDAELTYSAYTPQATDRVISRARYLDQLYGFWLGQSIANWSGLITEMDKVGTPATLPFYTDADWGAPDQKSVWGFYGPAPTIGFLFAEPGKPWGADDDTDIEYMYQHLVDQHNTGVLSATHIRDGWLHHIYSNEDAPAGENYLWVSNETAYYAMLEGGLLPPETSEPANNPDYEMIDAQLTTEIFGLFAPSRPDIALQMAHLPIRTTAKNNAEWAAEFYVIMYSLASYVDGNLPLKEQLFWLAGEARKRLPQDSYVASMYDFVRATYDAASDKNDWEACRDAVHQKYQLGGSQQAAGYVYRQPFDAGINFAAGLVSLFYGEGDLKRTIQIGSLVGWDSDNPTATWGGLLGFMIGRRGVEAAFQKTDFSETYWIHRTRRNFPDRTPGVEGEDTFADMAARGLFIVDRVVLELGGGVDLASDRWYIPDHGGAF